MIPNHIGELIEKYLDASVSDSELRELEAWLKLSDGNVDEFVRQVDVEVGLQSVLAGMPERHLAESVGAVEPRTAPRVAPFTPWRRIRWHVAAAAAVLAAAAGVWWRLTNVERGTAIARITELEGGVRGVGHAVARELKAGADLGAGSRLETKQGGTIRFQYLGEETSVSLSGLSDLSVCAADPSAPRAKRLELRRGKLAATVAPQSRSEGFVVLTPQAKIEVKGTRFTLGVDAKSTRLEVLEGLLGMTRLSDGKSVDVAAGQYAVAGEGAELVALALTGDALRAAESAFGSGLRGISKSRYGRVLFDDEFDGTLANWDVIVGITGGESRVVTGDPAPYVTLQKNLRHVQIPRQESSAIVLESCVMLDARDDPNQYVKIISKRPIEAERFVVEMRSVCSPTGGKTDARICDHGIDVSESGVSDHVAVNAIMNYGPMVTMRQWEFTPAPEKGENAFHCVVLRNTGKWSETAGNLARSCCVRPRSRKLVFMIKGSGWRLAIDRVRVREIVEDDVADSIQR